MSKKRKVAPAEALLGIVLVGVATWWGMLELINWVIELVR